MKGILVLARLTLLPHLQVLTEREVKLETFSTFAFVDILMYINIKWNVSDVYSWEIFVSSRTFIAFVTANSKKVYFPARNII